MLESDSDKKNSTSFNSILSGTVESESKSDNSDKNSECLNENEQDPQQMLNENSSMRHFARLSTDLTTALYAHTSENSSSESDNDSEYSNEDEQISSSDYSVGSELEDNEINLYKFNDRQDLSTDNQIVSDIDVDVSQEIPIAFSLTASLTAIEPPSESIKTANNNEHNKENKPKRIRERDYCFFCETLVLNFARHVERNHEYEIEVAEILSKPRCSKIRKDLLTKLRKKGNFIMNRGDNKKPMRKPILQDRAKLLPCTFCLGYYSSKQLYRHRKKCNQSASSKHQSEGQNCMIQHLKIDKNLMESVFPRMRADKVSLVAKMDNLICAFGARYMKIHREKHFLNVTSRKMRELAKLLIEIKKLDSSIKNLFEALQPQYFDLFVKATKIVGKYDEDKDVFMSPTYAMNIATSLKQCCDIAIMYAMKKADFYANMPVGVAETNLRTIIELFKSQWKFEISSQAADNLNMHTWNKVTLVPLASDVKLLKQYLEAQAKIAVNNLTENNNCKLSYCNLMETIYCRVLILNRKRPGELQRLLLHFYEESETKKNLYQEFQEVLSPTEKILMSKFKRIVIRGKRNRGVPVLISNDVQDDIKVLLRYRSNFVTNNPFLFGKPDSNSTICGYKVLRKHSLNCGAKYPDAISSTKLRKHLATITQIFNLNENEIEQLATFMGHTTNVHRKSYRLPDDIYQTAKISKLLLLMENGEAAAFKGKSLDEIEVDLDTNLLEDGVDKPEDIIDLQDLEKNISSNAETPEEPEASIKKDIPSVKPTKKIQNKRILEPWSANQKKVVENFFKNHISNKRPPRKMECEELKRKYADLLENKSWLKIKVYVQNQYKKK